MKTILALLTTLALAAPALATETADMVPGGAPASRCAIGTESGTTWTGNDASNPIFCSLTSGGFSSSGLATTARQDTGNTSLLSITTNTGTTANNTTSLDAKTPAFCTSVPLGAAWNANGAETDAAATLTGVCASGTCKRLIVRNWDTTNSVMVQFNSSTGTAGVCINPASAAGQPTTVDSSLWVAPSVGVTNVYRTTTGTTSCPTAATVGAAHMDLIGCQ